MSHEGKYTDPPSAFVVHWISALARRVPDRRALDVAVGKGRHAVALAEAGFRVFAVDISLEAVRNAIARADAAGVSIRGWSADLTAHPLPRRSFGLIVVTRYLQRDLFVSLRDALVPGGGIIYETFTVAQRALGRGPTSPDHLLLPGELKGWFDGFDALAYEEVEGQEAVARFAGLKQ